MRKRSTFLIVGMIIYIVMSGLDRFVVKIPNPVYIPVVIIGLALVIAGAFSGRNKDKTGGTK